MLFRLATPKDAEAIANIWVDCHIPLKWFKATYPDIDLDEYRAAQLNHRRYRIEYGPKQCYVLVAEVKDEKVHGTTEGEVVATVEMELYDGDMRAAGEIMPAGVKEPKRPWELEGVDQKCLKGFYVYQQECEKVVREQHKRYYGKLFCRSGSRMAGGFLTDINYLVLHGFAVKPVLHRHGIGKMLSTICIRLAQDERAPVYLGAIDGEWLDCRSPATSFYLCQTRVSETHRAFMGGE